MAEMVFRGYVTHIAVSQMLKCAKIYSTLFL